MSTTARSNAAQLRKRREVTRRRRFAALALIALTLLGSAAVVVLSAPGQATRTSHQAAVAPGEVEFDLVGERAVDLPIDKARRLAGRDDLPFEDRRRIERGNLTQTLELDRATLERRIEALGPTGGQIIVPETLVASRLDVPVIQQEFRNNCETAALSMLLASVGVNASQVKLQDRIAKATPLDPQIGSGGEQIWGDPNRGFVGRYDGGGPAGGFGVFPGPIVDLAAKFADPVNLSESSPAAVYRRLLAGHAVMAWIGLSDGPYSTWTSPVGNEVTVNFGEHTVLLTGIAGDRIFVNDPLDGLKKVWTREEFEAKWNLLGDRAVSV